MRLEDDPAFFYLGRVWVNGTKYGTGYALGAEAAAADLGLGENSITLDYTYRKSSSVSPSYLEKIKSWYGESGQILFSDGASYQNVLGAAASRQAEH